jgi:hypothetical protein
MYHKFKCNQKRSHSNAKCRGKTKCLKLGATLLCYKVHHQHLNNDNKPLSCQIVKKNVENYINSTLLHNASLTHNNQ